MKSIGFKSQYIYRKMNVPEMEHANSNSNSIFKVIFLLEMLEILDNFTGRRLR